MEEVTSPAASATQSKQVLVRVEGNIGSGKSTFLRKASSLKDVETAAGPMQKWTNFRGSNLLEISYTDPERWIFSFQSYALLTLKQEEDRPIVKRVKLMERSPQSVHCFNLLALQRGKLTAVEYELLEKFILTTTDQHQTDYIPEGNT